jgi:hypothetical protein
VKSGLSGLGKCFIHLSVAVAPSCLSSIVVSVIAAGPKGCGSNPTEAMDF